LHPIEQKLRNQFDEEKIVVEIVTVNNVDLNIETAKSISKITKSILFSYANGFENIYIVWSGMPIYNAVIYNVVKKVCGKNPIFLVFDNISQKYIEFDIEARKMLN
jgi:hypothetical protein